MEYMFVSLALPVDRNELFSWPAETLPRSGTTFYSGKVNSLILTSNNNLN